MACSACSNCSSHRSLRLSTAATCETATKQATNRERTVRHIAASIDSVACNTAEQLCKYRADRRCVQKLLAEPGAKAVPSGGQMLRRHGVLGRLIAQDHWVRRCGAPVRAMRIVET